MNNLSVQDDIRELTPAELNEVGGGFLNITFNNSDVGIGQVNQASLSLGNVNIGVGEINV